MWGNLFADIMQSLICMLHIPDQTAIYNAQYTYYMYLVVRGNIGGISVHYPLLHKVFLFFLSCQVNYCSLYLWLYTENIYRKDIFDTLQRFSKL